MVVSNNSKVTTNAVDKKVEYNGYWSYGTWGLEAYSKLYRCSFVKTPTVTGRCYSFNSAPWTQDASIAQCWGWGTAYAYYNYV